LVVKRPVRRADKLDNFMCRKSWIPGPSTYWNTHGFSRPVMGFHYLYLLLFPINRNKIFKTHTIRLCQTLNSRHSGKFLTFIIRSITAVLLFVLPVNILPLGTLSHVTVTSVISFRQCTSSLFPAPCVLRYVMTTTAARIERRCLQHWYLYVLGISKTYLSLFIHWFLVTLGNCEVSVVKFIPVIFTCSLYTPLDTRQE